MVKKYNRGDCFGEAAFEATKLSDKKRKETMRTLE